MNIKTIEEKAKAYDEALNWMRELYPGLHGATKEDAEHYFPELRKEEKPLTLFQQCLNCILRGVYYAEVPDEKVNEFIVNTVRTRTDELIKLAKKHEHANCQLRESEDERIRKRLIDFISNIKAISESGRNSLAIRKDDAEMCNAFLAYLEKQKDHFRDDTKKVEKQDYSDLTDLERAIHRCFLSAGVENVPVTIIKETAKECLAQMKPAEQDYDNRIQYDSVKSGIKSFASTYSFNIESKLFPQLTKEQQQIWKEEIEQAAIAGGESGVELSRDNRYKENRMIGWSEDDKSFYDSIMCEVIKEGMHPTPAQANWLKSLPERFNLQPKQEWSEEDELFLGVCKNALSKYERSDKWGANIISKWLETRLKSLRPVSKESLQPHWKPSNAQINYLGAAVIEAQRRHNESVNGFPRYHALKELYEQLLKL